jgi:hypothetical protein
LLRAQQLEETIQHLSSVTTAFASMVEYVNDVEDAYIYHFRELVYVLYVVYGGLFESQRLAQHVALAKLFKSLYFKGNALSKLTSEICMLWPVLALLTHVFQSVRCFRIRFPFPMVSSGREKTRRRRPMRRNRRPQENCSIARSSLRSTRFGAQYVPVSSCRPKAYVAISATEAGYHGGRGVYAGGDHQAPRLHLRRVHARTAPAAQSSQLIK